METYHAILHEGQEMEMTPKKYPMTMGISDVSDWIVQGFLFDMINRGASSLCRESTWTFTNRAMVQPWIDATFKDHRRVATASRASYVWFGDDCLIDFYIASTMITVNAYGNPEKIAQVQKLLHNSPFDNAECTIEWVHSEDGSSVNVPLRKRRVIHSAYPWLKDGLDTYIQNYLKSESSVLVLIGPPGTGKTSFIRHLITSAEATALVTYDERVMGTDSLFANWLDSSNQFIVLEDSDNFLKARAEGNNMMHKFLNVSEGLITVPGKKMIFSTNLPNVSDIDPALLRNGRCFDVLNFRALTPDEAWDVIDEVKSDREIDESRTYTLAELFAGSDSDLVPKEVRAKFGFAP
jgi:hypothetical protein